ncbi:acyl-CoA dehydrogenase family protein [Streptomyces sp. ISL-100]|uniref:acyl-CoA dehydrogenase family protein n=1 Tax=Streptomyces sp. ISL-100 TaxID=2819173 RepID=UPI001BE57000|nr:acyl-CoA dehydrogenase family protein [Streptomyces sp. ISL-100]MBT2401740.1 acyl-CoA/acyl-ACP dehydrogenase [Streptomyces sp. ISL-100]
MRFLLTEEQAAFGRSLEAMLRAADTPSVVRSWAAGNAVPGNALWARMGEAGVFSLAVPEAYEGVGPLPVELAVAFVELGRHAVPGPVVETVATAALLAHLAGHGEEGPAKRLLPTLASGGTSATLTLPGGGPYALDADSATYLLTVHGDELRLAHGYGALHASADPARRLYRTEPGGELLASGPAVTAAAEYAAGRASFATAAQALGTGVALLDRTVAYVKQRTQFGTAIGGFQAVKHRLADTLIGLEFARPLLFGAALSMTSADIAAAKVTAGEAAYAAARTALQLHGAVGYTDELDLSLWLRKARPLRDAWGTPSECRSKVLAAPTP